MCLAHARKPECRGKTHNVGIALKAPQIDSIIHLHAATASWPPRSPSIQHQVLTGLFHSSSSQAQLCLASKVLLQVAKNYLDCWKHCWNNTRLGGGFAGSWWAHVHETPTCKGSDSFAGGCTSLWMLLIYLYKVWALFPQMHGVFCNANILVCTKQI